MPLVNPLPPDADPEVRKLAEFFNETLGFCPNSVLTMQRRPAIAKAFISLNMAVMENKGKIRMNDLRIKALINILSKEGILTSDEVEEELNELVKIKDNEEE